MSINRVQSANVVVGEIPLRVRSLEGGAPKGMSPRVVPNPQKNA